MIHDIPSEVEPVPSLRDYLRVIRVRKWSVILVTLLITSCTLGTFFLWTTPTYASHVRVLVDPPDLTAGGNPVVVNLETERELLTSAPIAERVADEVDYQGSLRDLLRDLSVDISAGTEILEIEYESPDPQRAARIAQAFADGYLSVRSERARQALLGAANSVRYQLESREQELQLLTSQLQSTPSASARATLEARLIAVLGHIAALQQQLSLLLPQGRLYVGQVIEPAEVPKRVSSPSVVLITVLAGLGGLVIGIGVAFLRNRIDDRVRGEEDLPNLDPPYLVATIPRVRWPRKRRTLLVTLRSPGTPATEAFRTLRAKFLFVAGRRPLRTVLVTSPDEGEGKSSTAGNLAVVLSQAEKRVILISADLRRSRLHKFFDVSQSPGLSDILEGKISWGDASTQVGADNLRLISGGQVTGHPGDLLGGHRMKSLLDDLKPKADFVLIDAAPILGTADSLLLASMVDAVVLVADAGATTRPALRRAVRELEQVGATVAGVVLNRFDPRLSTLGDLKNLSLPSTPRTFQADPPRDPAVSALPAGRPPFTGSS